MVDLLPKILRRLNGMVERTHERFNAIASRDLCRLGTGVRLIGDARVLNFNGSQDDIMIGRDTVILGEICAFSKGAKIQIGEETYIGPGSNVRAFESIIIGSRVQISFNVNVYDNNSHSTSAHLRYEHARTILSQGHPLVVEDLKTLPIVIEDDVWIGFGSTILKGVKIGRGAIIGAGSLVTKDVPPFTIIAGNPPRAVGQAKD